MAYKKDLVAEKMRAKMRAGEWGVGDSVGDIFKLAQEFGVSIGTVRAAEEKLVGEGLLSEIQPGIPTRVIAIPPTTNAVDPRLVTRLRGLYAELGAVLDDLEAAG